MTEAVNWSELKRAADDATKPPPPGDHVCEVVKCEATRAATSGNPMLKATLRIVEGPAAGKTVFNNFNVTLDNSFAMSIFFRHMTALGLDDAFFAGGPAMEQVAAALVGRRARFTLSTRQWQGQDRAQVDAVQPLGGVQVPQSGVTVVGGPEPIVTVPGTPSSTPSTPSTVPSTPTTPVTTPTTPGVPTTPSGPPPPVPAF